MTVDFHLAHVQLTVPAGQEDQARDFYGSIVGLSEIPRPPELENRTCGSWFALGDRQLHLEGVEDFRPSPKAHLAIEVRDFDGLRRRLEAAGAELSAPFTFQGKESFFAYDPAGNWIEFAAAAPS